MEQFLLSWRTGRIEEERKEEIRKEKKNKFDRKGKEILGKKAKTG